MRGLLLHVSDEELERRRKLGLDRRDEMWEGVLHMAPAPTFEHQRIQGELASFLIPLLRRNGRGTLTPGINVFREPAPVADYRIPDLTFVAAGREEVIAEDGIRGGPPDAVIEIRSPDDETYEKLPFFAAIGVREVIVVDRDTKRPEVFRLAGPQYLVTAADPEGAVASEALGVRLRTVPGEKPRLRLEDLADRAEATEI